MENQYNKSGAGRRASWLPNNTLSAIVAAIGACQIAIANDRNAIVAADNEGNVFKAMCGTATDNSDFTFTNTTMQFPIPFTLAFGDQTTEGSKRIRITTSGVFVETYQSSAWVELGAFI